MYSIGILSTVLFALIATSNALNCRPVTCMLACPLGFALDTEGCPHCSCRQQADICRDPIFGYNCGSIDHRDCPSSHECKLDFGGFSGLCCVKAPSSTTSRPATGTSTARATLSTARATSTRRMMSRFAFDSESTTGAAQSTTGASQSTTQSSATTGQSGDSTTGSQAWANFDLSEWINGVGAK